MAEYSKVIHQNTSTQKEDRTLVHKMRIESHSPSSRPIKVDCRPYHTVIFHAPDSKCTDRDDGDDSDDDGNDDDTCDDNDDT